MWEKEKKKQKEVEKGDEGGVNEDTQSKAESVKTTRHDRGVGETKP